VTFAGFIHGGAAETSGLQPGDLIRRIDGADASAYTTVECMQNLRGPEGSRVTVEVERGGQRVSVTIQRRAMTF
jgi:C-terminal processing protease CtpA/Prc